MTDAKLSNHGLARLHDVTARHVERGTAPGVVSVISRRGEAQVDVIGATAVSGGQPVRPDTIFRISSMTRPITVRDLLTFRMGFGGYFGPCPVNDVAAPLQLSVGPPQPSLPPEPNEWMRRFSTLPLMFQPGERWLYHTGADILGVLIARATGQPFETFLREWVFEPLGMTDTAFCVPASGIGRFATSSLTDPQT